MLTNNPEHAKHRTNSLLWETLNQAAYAKYTSEADAQTHIDIARRILQLLWAKRKDALHGR